MEEIWTGKKSVLVIMDKGEGGLGKEGGNGQTGGRGKGGRKIRGVFTNKEKQ